MNQLLRLPLLMYTHTNKKNTYVKEKKENNDKKKNSTPSLLKKKKDSYNTQDAAVPTATVKE